ncbi:MAG: protein kinase, partial [bacterium]|nr:protein kinase [Candidatus Kapabacteria bacterium]
PRSRTTNPESADRFLREARSAAQINHPNVCTVFDIIEADDERFIVMEFVEGSTLRDIVGAQSSGPSRMPIDLALEYTHQIAAALIAAHDRGIVHRDVKSENVMVDASGRVKVMDFGLAKMLEADRMTRTNTTVGTIAYMAPERIRDEESDVRADVFAVGVILYEMLVGRLPFRGAHDAAMIYSILNETPPPIATTRSDVSEELERVVMRALEKDVARRYESMRAFVQDLSPLSARVSAPHVAEPPAQSVAIASTRTTSKSATPSRSTRSTASSGSSTGRTTELRVYVCALTELADEREHLIRKTFPELRALCRDHGVSFAEVDMRAAGTRDDERSPSVLRASLEEIDRCRPYFIGILGREYGDAPEFNALFDDPLLLASYPWVEDAILDGESALEIECRLALENAATIAATSDGLPTSTRFYVRREHSSNDREPLVATRSDQLVRLIDRIRDSGVPVNDYRDSTGLGGQIFDDLDSVIREHFAHRAQPSPLERERRAHDAFATSRRRAFVPNPIRLRELNAHVLNDDPTIVVVAPSGSGKSSLLAYWCDQHRRRWPDAFVVEHYVGVGAADHIAVMRHIIGEIKERYERDEPIPAD